MRVPKKIVKLTKKMNNLRYLFKNLVLGGLRGGTRAGSALLVLFAGAGISSSAWATANIQVFPDGTRAVISVFENPTYPQDVPDGTILFGHLKLPIEKTNEFTEVKHAYALAGALELHCQKIDRVIKMTRCELRLQSTPEIRISRPNKSVLIELRGERASDLSAWLLGEGEQERIYYTSDYKLTLEARRDFFKLDYRD